MAHDTVTLTRADGVATLTLNRPDAFNALDLTLGRDLFHAVVEVDDDPAVRAVVITGAGKAFCAGGDVKGFADNADRIGALIKELTTYLHGAVSRLCRSEKPVIMAINGVAAGGGMSLALAGDFVLAAESARFTMAYSKIAATPDGSSTYFLPRLIGLRRAPELYLTNRALSARDARVRRRQAPVPSVDVGESGDADGARGAGDRRQRPHRRLPRRGDRVREQTTRVAVPRAIIESALLDEQCP